MKRSFLKFILPAAFAFCVLTACENGENKNNDGNLEGEADVHTMPADPEHPALQPDTANLNDTGATGGNMNEGDPSSSGNNSDEDKMNSNGEKKY